MRIDKWVRGILTLGLVGVSCYLVVMEMEVPLWLAAATGGTLGQYAPIPGRGR